MKRAVPASAAGRRSHGRAELSGRGRRFFSDTRQEDAMGRGLLLWLIGIPLPIILIVWLLGGLHG